MLAYEALRAVAERDAYANLVLPPLLHKARKAGRLDARDAALATELVYGTLRRQGSYDAIIAECTDRPLSAIDPPVLDVLSLGAHQLLGTRIPPHAAVSASVELARCVLDDPRARFVNAVLRRIGAHDVDTWLQRLAPPYGEDPEGHLGLLHAHPRWIVSALWDALGGGRAEIEALLAADNERPEVTLVARPGLADATELLRAVDARPGRWSPYAVRMSAGGEPGALDAVREQRAGVQDEGSQLVAAALARAPVAGRDERWLDACAGPGGKAALLAALAAERGAALLAAESQPHRARLVERALRAGRAGHAVVAADSTRPAWLPGTFDRVLVDVPCTGLGALRRRPEARWRRRPDELEDLAPLQRELLYQALSAVRVGGVVGYVTCSPHRAETRAVVEDVTAALRRAAPESGAADRAGAAARPGVEQAAPTAREAEWLDARPLLPGVPELGDGPDVQLWPHRHGTDAMYLALLRRTA